MVKNIDEIITMVTILQAKLERLKQNEIARENYIRKLKNKINEKNG